MLDVILGTRRTAPASRPRGYSPESASFPLNSPDAWDNWLEGSRETTSGLRVSHRSALCHPAFWMAVAMISDDVASITYKILKQDGDGDYLHDPDHPADYLIGQEANEDTPCFESIALLMVHALVWGNGYQFIERTPSGEPLNLLPLLPDRTRAHRDLDGSVSGKVGTLYYETTVNSQKRTLRAADVVHLKGLQLWAELGVDQVEFHRELIGLGESAFSFASQFYRRGGRAGGILLVPPTMQKPAVDTMLAGFEKAYEQPGAHFKTIVARDGSKWEKMSMSPVESQMVEGRAADARDFARIFKIPPQKLGLPDAVGFASLEQSQRQYFQQALMPWVLRYRAQCRLRLLTKQQRRGRTHDIGFDASNIVQLDEKTLNEILGIQRQNAVINANEWRQRIGMETRDDEEADRYVNPNTTAPDNTAPDAQADASAASPGGAGAQDEQADTTAAATEGPPAQNRISDAALAALVGDVTKRMLSRLTNDAQRHASSPATFLRWLDDDLVAHRQVIQAAFAPVAAVVAEARAMPPGATAATWCDSLIQHVRIRLDQYTQPPHDHKALALHVAGEAKRLLSESDILAYVLCPNLEDAAWTPSI